MIPPGTLHHPFGSLRTADDLIDLSPGTAGWTYTGMRVFSLAPGDSDQLQAERNWPTFDLLICLRGLKP